MIRRVFHIVDVFAERKYTGNQLAVVVDAGGLSADQMQRITREFNFSETTFIVGGSRPGCAFPVRIFTPGQEVPFAGHPTVGTAWVIRNLLTEGRPDRVHLDLEVGRIPVAFDDRAGLAWMTTREPVLGPEVPAGLLSEVLGLDARDLDDRFPAQVVSTGLPALIVPVVGLEAVRRAQVRIDRLHGLARTHEVGKAILLFCGQTVDPAAQLHVRVFAPLAGVPEDPATGSANSCLAGYLARHRYFGPDSVDIRVEQGMEMGRPSQLYLKADDKNANISVSVGGKVQHVARGELM